MRARIVHATLIVILIAALVAVPWVSIATHGVLPGPLDSPGTLQLLGLCLVFAGLAVTYDLLFGFAGLLSFGHALFFAIGVYVACVAMNFWDLGFWTAIALTAAVALVVSIAVGAVSLRIGGIAFAMVTLAFAQAGAVLVQKNPDKLTAGDEGLSLSSDHLPSIFVGVFNAKYTYWLALGYAIVIAAVAWWFVDSSPGRVLLAIRENARRVEVLGFKAFPFKLVAFVLSAVLASIGGIVYLVLVGGATPEVTSPNFTLTLLIMVVLGGAGTRWGALVGGAVYILLDNRLVAVASSSDVQNLPRILRTPLAEPLFVLGAIFILVVFFLPGGIVGLGGRSKRPRALAQLEQAVRPRDGGDPELEPPA